MRRTLRTDPADLWRPYEPGADAPWDRDRVAHLHRRAGFAASWDVLERDVADGPEAAIARLLDGEATALDGQPAATFDRDLDALMADAAASGNLVRLQGAWIYRMIFTHHPLRERLTLCWHGHFATSQAKVNNLGLMWGQNRTLRANALGSFRDLLAAMGRDPAMLLWLDAATSRKAHPNENYAREVMELFALGRGAYTEKDIQEAARAFTGRFVQGDRVRDVPAQHDAGPKTILGQTGEFDGDAVAGLLVAQPPSARFLARKLHRWLVSEVGDPTDDQVEPLAEELRASGFDIQRAVGFILRSRLFHDPATRRKRVKGPVELVVGTHRALEMTRQTASPTALAEACARMGQGLFTPPNVAGWPGGPAWINSASTLERTNLMLALLSDSDERLGKRLDAAGLASRHGRTGAEAAAGFFADLLLGDGLGADARAAVASKAAADSDPAAAAHTALGLVLTAPEFQLA